VFTARYAQTPYMTRFVFKRLKYLFFFFLISRLQEQVKEAGHEEVTNATDDYKFGIKM
jgi:CMP-2-keto-3-deoxyoctulosonic acid synthetase